MIPQVFQSDQFFLIAGPCVIEDPIKGKGFTLAIARELKSIANQFEIPLIFKASYDKANRTSHTSFRGPGLEKGLEILEEIHKTLSLPILTDVHCTQQVKPAAQVAHILQIPAFLCRQTDLVQKAAKEAKAINVKKGQFLAPWDMKHVVAKIRAVADIPILLTERGTSFGYNNLVVDMRAIAWMKKLECKVVFDATHSVQLPGAQGSFSGGMPEMIPPLSRAAVAAGAQGIFMEVHPDPSTALSDGSNALKLSQLPKILKELVQIFQLVQNISKEQKEAKD